MDEWETRPLEGRGAGSYESWWAEHGSFAYFLRDAHSLYLETLGEFGILGFLTLAGALVTGLVAGICRLRASADGERAARRLAARELRRLPRRGRDRLGLGADRGLGRRHAPARPAHRAGDGRRGTRTDDRREPLPGPAARASASSRSSGCGRSSCAQAIPLLADVKLSASETAVRNGDGPEALGHAEDARRLEPWAASPYLQLALVREAMDDLPGALVEIRKATDRDPLDWRLWLARARIETNSGEIAEARRSLARAAELNPRSPLFADVQ